MNYKLFTEDKIDLLQLAFENLPTHSHKGYNLLDRTRMVLHSLLKQEDHCKNIEQCIDKLDLLIEGIEAKIRMKENKIRMV